MIYDYDSIQIIALDLIKECKNIAIIGAGGKTTTMYYLASYVADLGYKAIATTATHIYCPLTQHRAFSIEDVRYLWSNRKYAVLGEDSSDNKLSSPDINYWKAIMDEADYVFVEADGARGLPCKLWKETEPVIWDNTDLIIILMGVKAVGKTFKEGCARYELLNKGVSYGKKDIISKELLAGIVVDEYRHLITAYPDKKYAVIINQCDNEADIDCAKNIIRLINNDIDIRCYFSHYSLDNNV